eukprot:894854-Rhodomonas_salina.1
MGGSAKGESVAWTRKLQLSYELQTRGGKKGWFDGNPERKSSRSAEQSGEEQDSCKGHRVVKRWKECALEEWGSGLRVRLVLWLERGCFLVPQTPNGALMFFSRFTSIARWHSVAPVPQTPLGTRMPVRRKYVRLFPCRAFRSPKHELVLCCDQLGR